MDSIVHFEIPAANLARAKKFYQKTFNWKLQDLPEQNYVMAYTTEVDKKYMPKKPGAINGGIQKRDKTAPYPILVVNVASIKRALAKIKKAGGKLVMPSMKVMDMGMYARVKDSEGNIIGVWENLKP